ncbi:MAG: HEAT repeat domain-containing protein [Verrucomicrobiota bacterium]
MLTRKRIGAASSAVLILFALTLVVIWPREPSYEGVKLSVWLADLDFPRVGDTMDIPVLPPNMTPDQIKAAEAVRKIGTDALPFVLDMLNPDEPSLRRRFRELMKKQSVVKMSALAPATEQFRAVRACQALGPLAEPAVPYLIEMLAEPDRKKRMDINRALKGIGPNAIDRLVSALSHTNAQVRAEAAAVLGLNGQAASRAVPPLIRCLKSSDKNERSAAARSLGRIATHPEVAVPELRHVLVSDEYSHARMSAAYGLSGFGAKATDAVPDLLRALTNETDRSTRIWATNALKKIDPQAASLVGIKR